MGHDATRITSRNKVNYKGRSEDREDNFIEEEAASSDERQKGVEHEIEVFLFHNYIRNTLDS